MSAPPTPQKLLPTSKCTLGCPILDRLLGGGGIPCNTLTEIVSESGVGKTQLCLQLCLSAQLPPRLGGLSASSLFLHSEYPFPSRRLLHIAHSFRRKHSLSVDPRDNIFVRGIDTAPHLLDEMPKIESLIISLSGSELPVRIIVLDSVAALFRSEFDNNRDDLRRRSSLFFSIAGELKRLANRFELAVLVTNQVVDFVDEGGGVDGGSRRLWSSGRRVCAALGLAWANCVNTRLFLSRDEVVVVGGDGDGGESSRRRTRRQMRVVFAPHLPESLIEFVVTKDGVFGVEGESEIVRVL